MSGLARQAAYLAVAFALSWWAVRAGRPRPDGAGPPSPSLAVALLPGTVEPAGTPPAADAEPPPAVSESDAAVGPPPPGVADEPAPPPPPELGSPDGTGEEAPGEAADEPREPDASTAAEVLLADGDLRARARAELAGDVRPGFATVLVASPEAQLAIARHFGEEIVLVPRAALDPEAGAPRWYRLSATGAVEAVDGRPPLEGYRQYRDLFDYEYARLPDPLRALRRAVPARSDVWLFAALIPAGEWTLVCGRRREALARAGRAEADVRRFVLRYVDTGGGGFDFAVDEVVLADGTRILDPLGKAETP